jgi:hypothetical protein
LRRPLVSTAPEESQDAQANTAPETSESPETESEDMIEEFDLDDIEVIESKVFG